MKISITTKQRQNYISQEIIGELVKEEKEYIRLKDVCIKNKGGIEFSVDVLDVDYNIIKTLDKI